MIRMQYVDSKMRKIISQHNLTSPHEEGDWIWLLHNNTNKIYKVKECVLSVFDHIENNEAFPIWICLVEGKNVK